MSEWDKDAPEHDPAISAIYRNTGNLTPPTSLDDAILAAARRTAWRRRQRWMLPLSTAAVVVVSVALLMNMGEEWNFSKKQPGNSPTSQSLPVQSQSAPRMKDKYEASAPDTSREKTVDDVPHAIEHLVVREAKPASKEATSGETKTKKSAPVYRGITPDVDSGDSGTPVPAIKQTPQSTESTVENSTVTTLSKEISPRSESEYDTSDKNDDTINPSLERKEEKQKPAGSQSILPPEETAEQKTLEPRPWITKIRKLVTDGKTEAARKELESFKKRYPKYILPADLKSL